MTNIRVLLCTYGSRGDVEPFVALATGLQQAGFEVGLATSTRFAEWAEGLRLGFLPLSDSSLGLIDSPDGKTVLDGGSSLARRIVAGVRLSRTSVKHNAEIVRDLWAAAQEFSPDLIVFHPKLFAAPHMAAKLRIPAMLGALQPMIVPTADFPAMGLPDIPLPGFNRLSYALVVRGYGLYRKAIDRFRQQELDLPKISSAREVLFPPEAEALPVLHAISPQVINRPGDWPQSAHLTGYWRLENRSEFIPPEPLATFLERGPSPVFAGFGSMTANDPAALGHLLVDAIRRTGRRGVIAKGWAGLAFDDAEDMIAIDPLPFDWLFPRTAAVVHHGGAGTTSEGFHAGVPSVICPFVGDQPGWARLTVELGVGARPVPRRRLTAERLARSIDEAVSNPTMRDNAARLGERLMAEDGVATAVDLIEATLRGEGRARVDPS